MSTAPQTIRDSVCAHDCPDTCGIKVAIQDGQITGLTGDPHHPITRGLLCGKVSRYAERVYSPQRILTPLRRVGAKGEGRFEPVSWEQALKEIGTRFRDIMASHGAEAILPYSYGGTIGRVGFYAGHQFFFHLGASQLQRTICSGSVVAGLDATMGIGVASDIQKAARAKLIILWGVNAVATHLHMMPLVREARRNGARLVVIDAYRNATARQADQFLQVRPGTDAALALGMMREILASGLENSRFVEQFTLGLEELREACAPYTPQRVEELTGVSAAEVVQLARSYGEEPDSFIRMGLGPSRHGNGGMTVRTVSCLPALTGAWESPGGGFLALGWGSVCQGKNFLMVPPAGLPRTRRVNMVRLGEALLDLDDPPIKALYVYNSNPAAIAPEQARVLAGLAREDLFLVVHEQTHTDTVDFADIVLPATTFLEHDDLCTSYGHNYIQISRAAIPPRGEAKSNLETFSLLAREMGLEDPVLHMGFEAMTRRLLEDILLVGGKAELDEFWAGRPVLQAMEPAPWRKRLATPSGRFEFTSTRLERRGLSPVPAFVPSPEGHLDNELKARFPLQLLTPPSQHFLNSSFGDAEGSRRREQTPRIKMHPADAKKRGLIDGSACHVYNDRGSCQLTVEVTRDVAPGVVVAESIWWPKWMVGRKGINQLTSAELTDMGDCARFHDGLVEIQPARNPVAGSSRSVE